MRLAVKWSCVLALCCAAAGAFRAQAAPLFIEELTWTEVRDAVAAGSTTALLYAGSTEQNGPHMATGKHNAVARHVARAIAKKLGNALVYPILPFAPTGDAEDKTGHMRFPGSVTVSGSTFAAVMREEARSARAAGFRLIVLMGDHGGGQQVLKQVAEELDEQWRDEGTRVVYCGDLYYRSEQLAEQFLAEHGLKDGTHAGIIDTSELLYVDRASVRRGEVRRAADGQDTVGVNGDPRLATPALGRRFIQFKIDSAVEQIRRLAGG